MTNVNIKALPFFLKGCFSTALYLEEILCPSPFQSWKIIAAVPLTLNTSVSQVVKDGQARAYPTNELVVESMF